MERRAQCEVTDEVMGQSGVSQGWIRKRSKNRNDIVDELVKRSKASSAERECVTVVGEERVVPQASADRHRTYSEDKTADHQDDELENEFIGYSEHSLASEQVEKVSKFVQPDAPVGEVFEQGDRTQGTRKSQSPPVGDRQTEQGRRSKNHQRAGASLIEPIRILETQRTYCVSRMNDILPCVEYQLGEGPALQRSVQVPSWREDKNHYNLRVQTKIWRIKSTHPCYSIEGTEDIGDQVFLKRHEKMEKEEKQRKKWDMQRMCREQQLQRLLARQEKQHAVQTTSLLPSLEAATHICVDDNIPVSAFGRAIPSLPHTTFSLPWLEASSTSSRLYE